MLRVLALVALIALFTPHLRAADLTKIERTIRKEPAYQSKKPRYCLLVFGPEAKTRVWLVLDGKTLYVDRNGNGDLTEDGEKIAAKRGVESLDEDEFEVEEIRDDARTHKNLTLIIRKVDYLTSSYPDLKPQIARLPEGRGYHLHVDVDAPEWKGKGSGGRIRQVVSFLDAGGFLTFADKLREAPIIHFGGPWQMQCRPQNRLMAGREADLMFSLGTPGLGVGTTAHLYYEETVPPNVHPRVEITYPPAKAGEPPLKRLYELKDRC
jgi:hypothetical protein